MKNLHLFCLGIMLSFSGLLIAQTKTISGKVLDESGVPLPGATIAIVNTAQGTLSDFDGDFSINATVGEQINVSYVGYQDQLITIDNQDNYTVVLIEGNPLSEVVVTALGIRREEKTLSYANQTVDAQDITQSRDINFVNSISGKAAGVEIRKSSSGPGGSTKIQIRGSKSVSGDSQPLFVIDGIPMVNNRGDQPGLWDGVDGGDGLSQLNPDDIESMTILRGASAAILYGSQGANGVVIITTKSGKEGATEVNLKTGVTFENIIQTPELQFRYGSDGGTKESWSTTKGNYKSNYVKDYFETGVNNFNSVAISGGNDKTTAYFSFANTTANGVTPKNKYGKNNLSFKQSTKLFDDRITITSNILLSQEKTSGRNRAGYYNNPLTGLYWFPRDKNFNEYKKNYSIPNPARNTEQMNWFVADHLQSNPYWLINKESQEDKTDRVIGSVNVDYKINEAFNIQLRGNIDYAVKSFDNQRSAGGNTTTVGRNGRWTFSDFTDQSTYFDAIITHTKNFGDFSINTIVGSSYQKTIFGDGITVDTDTSDTGMLYANEFNFQNIGSNIQVESTLTSRAEKQSLFGNVEVGYKDMLYFNIAGRNDWASTLAQTGNDSYFYPSFGVTALLSEAFELPEFVSFAKIRGTYASVANEVPFNKINPVHKIDASGAVEFNTVKPFRDAKPELINTFEIGLDWRFFNNRLGIDFTYYDITSKDQFIEVKQPIEDFTSFFVNAGEITNKGVELTLNAKPIVKQRFSWNTALNYSSNKNRIVKLHPDTQEIEQGGAEGIRVRLVEGGSVSDIYAFKFQRDGSGRILLDENSGRPLKTGERELIGNAEPNYSLGWNNSIRYQDFNLNFLINGKFGGIVASQTEALLDGYGVSERSAKARDRGYEKINAVQGGQAVSQIDPFDYYDTIGGRNGIDEPHIYDRTSVRLAQLVLGYTIDVSNNNWIKKASISFIGNNLFFLYKDAPFDPEITLSTGRDNAGIDNYNLPSTRTYGLNLSLTF